MEALREKEKMLVTSIFSFSHNVFYPRKTNLKFLVTFDLSPTNAFNLDMANILLFGKGIKQCKEILLCHALVKWERLHDTLYTCHNSADSVTTLNLHSSQLGRFRTYITPRLY